MSASLGLSHTTLTVVFVQQRSEAVRAALVSCMEGEKWRRATMAAETIRTIHPCIRDMFRLDRLEEGDIGQVVTSSDESLVFVQSVILLLTSISDYCKLADKIPQVIKGYEL